MANTSFIRRLTTHSFRIHVHSVNGDCNGLEAVEHYCNICDGFDDAESVPKASLFSLRRRHQDFPR